MKKLIYIFTAFISLFIFYSGYVQFSEIETERMLNFVDTAARNEETTPVLIELDFPQNQETFYETLISFVYGQDHTVIIGASEQDKDMIDYDKMFLYTKQQEVTLKNVFFK